MFLYVEARLPLFNLRKSLSQQHKRVGPGADFYTSFLSRKTQIVLSQFFSFLIDYFGDDVAV